MIYQNDYWYDVVPSKSASDGRHTMPAKTHTVAGKWLYWDDTSTLHALLPRLNDFVEQRMLLGAKVARKLPGIDPFPEKPCVLCVYTSDDPQDKEHARELLRKHFGLAVEIWKSEAQTMIDWSDDGWLRIQAEINRLRERLASGDLKDKRATENQLLSLIGRLESTIRATTNPAVREELQLNMLHESTQRMRTIVVKESSNIEMTHITSLLAKIEVDVALLSMKFESGGSDDRQNSEQEDENSVFIIMPFSEQHEDTYDTITRSIMLADAHLRPQRADERPGFHSITDEIHRCIRNAGIIVCDLTDERPNVYYELGYANGLGKSIVCIARQGTVLHFDVHGFKTLFFKSYRDLEQQLSLEIKRLRG